VSLLVGEQIKSRPARTSSTTGKNSPREKISFASTVKVSNSKRKLKNKGGTRGRGLSSRQRKDATRIFRMIALELRLPLSFCTDGPSVLVNSQKNKIP